MAEGNNPHSDDERVREHLANERTYLAWLRTGISLMGFGVVIARLRYLMSVTGQPLPDSLLHTSQLGLVFTAVGLLTVGAATSRFVTVQSQLRRGNYRSSARLILGLSAAVTAIGVLVLIRLALE